MLVYGDDIQDRVLICWFRGYDIQDRVLIFWFSVQLFTIFLYLLRRLRWRKNVLQLQLPLVFQTSLSYVLHCCNFAGVQHIFFWFFHPALIPYPRFNFFSLFLGGSYGR